MSSFFRACCAKKSGSKKESYVIFEEEKEKIDAQGGTTNMSFGAQVIKYIQPVASNTSSLSSAQSNEGLPVHTDSPIWGKSGSENSSDASKQERDPPPVKGHEKIYCNIL